MTLRVQGRRANQHLTIAKSRGRFGLAGSDSRLHYPERVATALQDGPAHLHRVGHVRTGTRCLPRGLREAVVAQHSEYRLL